MTIEEIQSSLIASLKSHMPPLRIQHDLHENFEVCGTKERMQGKKKVDGYYFASVRPKPKDIRLYFFPIYTHVDEFADIPDNLRKCLKGKSCFHIKKMDDALQQAINEMIQKGIDLYLKDDLI